GSSGAWMRQTHFMPAMARKREVVSVPVNKIQCLRKGTRICAGSPNSIISSAPVSIMKRMFILNKTQLMRVFILRSRFVLVALSILMLGRASAQEGDEFVPCQVMPQLITNYDADLASLRIAYTVEYSPERRARFEKLDRDYLDR